MSDLVSIMDGFRSNLALEKAFWGQETRPLEPSEVTVLLSQGNICEDWGLVRVTPGFKAEKISYNRFLGRSTLGCFEGRSGIYHSTLEDVEVAPGALVDRSPLVRRCWIEGEIVGSSVDCRRVVSYGLGRKLLAGLETGGRWIPVTDDLDMDSALTRVNSDEAWEKARKLQEKVRGERSYVGPKCRLFNVGSADGVFLVGEVQASVCAVLEDSCFLGTQDSPIQIGPGAIVRSSIVHSGVVVDSHAIVENSVFLEASGAEAHARIRESLVGPNTIVGSGEVHSCLLGPFVGLHHQSLLIAAWWPEGRGNLGYGANVGSNHTSRAPDQEIRPGEGMFFGLDCAVKFPSDFSGSPYSLIGTSVATEPQKMELPFSLILEDPLADEGLRGLPRVIPGWVLRENLYMLLRNEKKFQQRDRSRRHSFDFRVLRPEIVEKLWKTSESLASNRGKPVYTVQDFPVVGQNYLREEDRKKAVATYRDFFAYAALRLFAEKTCGIAPCDETWLSGVFERLNLDIKDTKTNLDTFLVREAGLWRAAQASKRKDDQRGVLIFPEYGKYHVEAERDAFLLEKEKELEIWKERIRAATAES